MKEIKLQAGQTLLDIAIQELGDGERLFELAQLNNISITALLAAGAVIIVPDFDRDKKRVVKVFAELSNKPASALGMVAVAGWLGELNPVSSGIEDAKTIGFKKVQIAAGQTLIDIAVQELGDAGKLFELAELNGKSITELLEAGAIVLVPDYDQDKKEVVQMFSDPALKPASNSTEDGTSEFFPQGIDYWAIGIDFIVS